jgi:drug/metabolite transporter (DMT)-like permease
MGILLGLLTALTWGGADFLARFATRRIGTLRAMFYMQGIGLVLLTIFLPWLGGWGHLTDGSGWQPWAWGLLAGGLNALSTLALYRAFEIGKMSVVAPLSASYPALTLLLSRLSGEPLTGVRTAGIFCVLLGAIVVARGEKAPDAGDTEAMNRSGVGIGWAILSGIGFGFLFWLLGTQIVPRVGTTQTVWMIRLTSTAAAAILIFAGRQAIRLPRDNTRWLVSTMGLLDTGAFILSNRGMQMEHIAVVSVLSSLYGAVTVALAAIFLRERISRWQLAGIVTIFEGILLIST